MTYDVVVIGGGPAGSTTARLLAERGYDVVMLETNRGCPYTCSFCYWGGATGQKLRKFSTDRISAELELAAPMQIPEVVLCDSNFGMLKEDEEFVETIIRLREQHGYPRSFETSWAKNKSKSFYAIVERMKKVGLRSSFTLALQTLSDPSLVLMKRKNMKVNDWRELAGWLKSQGITNVVALTGDLHAFQCGTILTGDDNQCPALITDCAEAGAECGLVDDLDFDARPAAAIGGLGAGRAARRRPATRR